MGDSEARAHDKAAPGEAPKYEGPSKAAQEGWRTIVHPRPLVTEPPPEEEQQRVNKMPVRKTGGGYKYGTKGKLYKGKGAKAKAARQGRAIQASKHRKKK